MVVSLHLVKCYVRMPHKFQHTPEIGLFLVTAIEFEFAITRDDDDGRSILSNVSQRCILIDGGLQRTDVLLLADVVVCNDLLIGYCVYCQGWAWRMSV